MTQDEILAQRIASGEYWLNETWFFVWFPLIAIGIYSIIRFGYKLEWEWIPFVYIAVCLFAVIAYHWHSGSWNTIIAGWINAIAWPTDKTGVELNRNWFGWILNYVYLGLFVLVVWTTYLIDKHDKP